MWTGQRVGQELKSLKKRVRFAEPFRPPGGGNATEGLQDGVEGLRTERSLYGS